MTVRLGRMPIVHAHNVCTRSSIPYRTPIRRLYIGGVKPQYTHPSAHGGRDDRPRTDIALPSGGIRMPSSVRHADARRHLNALVPALRRCAKAFKCYAKLRPRYTKSLECAAHVRWRAAMGEVSERAQAPHDVGALACAWHVSGRVAPRGVARVAQRFAAESLPFGTVKDAAIARTASKLGAPTSTGELAGGSAARREALVRCSTARGRLTL